MIAATLVTQNAADSFAATPCGQHDEIVEALTSKYQETRRILGVINASTVMEIFLSPMGSWTVLMTNTSGMSCINASGESWQEIPQAVAGIDS
jgi:hypothetical protein